MKPLIPSVKGTRDFYPEEKALHTWLYNVIRKVSSSFGYQEYDGPYLEKIDLYAAKSGDELVKEQAFVLTDRGGELLTLRPELTPTLARMVAQKQNELVYPLRWWSFGAFWRYEKPQRGRTREFFQWNIDLIGVNSPDADAELVAICARFFETVGLKPNQVQILVNNRRLMDQELSALGITGEDKKKVFRLIDRRDKMRPAEWEAYALEQGLSAQQFEGVKTLLSDPELWKKSEELRRFFTTLDSLGATEYVHYDPQIIRGLEYYTGIVFEAKDLDGGRSVLGGGHYDNLVGDVGGNPLPGVGFAMGDVMALLTLQKYGCVPELSTQPARVLVTVFDAERLPASFALAARLRNAGINVVCYPEAVKLQKQFKFADRLGARYVLIQGPDEEANGMVTLKDLSNGAQETLSVEALTARILEG